jgi:parallel beta-helix repeat protein
MLNMIPLSVFCKYRSINIFPAKSNFILLVRLLVITFHVFYLTAALLTFSMAFFGTNLGRAIAQMPSTPNSLPLGEKTNSQVNLLFVNQNVGDDTTGNGSESAPVKTITQALRLANTNTVIMLSSGTYSAETGEVFPLILKPGVSIQGNPSNQGKDMIIHGGGDYLSRSFGSQNVTIVGANQAVLTGVTVTNSNPRGYALWIESSNPVIRENTFIGSTQDGISVSGNAAPSISKNYFHHNGANGITIAGNSHPEVKENVFDETGFGINIAENAAPVIIGNQIQNNRSGIIVQANARPILRNNIIQNSKEDGLVAIAQAMPDLGNASELGGNEFQNNGRYDINASAAKQVISAAGNHLVSDRITGNIDMNGTTALVAENSQLTPVAENLPREISTPGEITFSAPSISQTTNGQISNSISPNNRVPAQLNTQLLPLLPASVPVSPTTSNEQTFPSQVAGFPTPSSLSGRQISTNTQITPAQSPNTPQLNYVRIDPKSIEFNAPQYPSNSVAQPAVPSIGNEALLPVSDRNLPTVPVVSSTTMAYGGNSGTFGIRYRVVVTSATDKDRDIVRSLAPGAFPTVWEGQKVMQAGVFDSEYNAKEMLKTLSNQGLRAIMEPLN